MTESDTASNLTITQEITILIDNPTKLLEPSFMAKVEDQCKKNPNSDELALVAWFYQSIIPDTDSQEYEFFAQYRFDSLQNRKRGEILDETFKIYSAVTQEIDQYKMRVENNLGSTPIYTHMSAGRDLKDQFADVVLRKALQAYAIEANTTKADPNLKIEYFINNETKRPGLFASNNGQSSSDIS